MEINQEKVEQAIIEQVARGSVSETYFRKYYSPISPAPVDVQAALVKALRGMIFSHFCDEDAGFDSVKVTCEFCREARAALALAGETGAKEAL